MMIIKISPTENGLRPMEYQSHRTECWQEGYIAVPSHLEKAATDSGGWCTLDIVDGELRAIYPAPRPPEPEPEPTTDELMDILLGVTNK